jgi:hypothetical protein
LRKKGKAWFKSMKDFKTKGIKLLRKDNCCMKECRKFKNFKGFKKCIRKSSED